MNAIKENTDKSFLELERIVRDAVKARALYKIRLFGDEGKAKDFKATSEIGVKNSRTVISVSDIRKTNLM